MQLSFFSKSSKNQSTIDAISHKAGDVSPNETARTRRPARLAPKGKHRFSSVRRSEALFDGVDVWIGRFNVTGTISVCHGASSLAPFVFFPKEDSRVRDILASWESCKYFFKCIFEDLIHHVSSIHQTLVSLKTCAECDVLIAFWHQLKLVVTRLWVNWLSLPNDGTSCSLCGGSLCEDIVHHNSYIFCQALLTDHGCVILGGFVEREAVYKAVVLSALLYGCESWTLYRRHTKLLDQFHQRCLRRIMNIKWFNKVTNVKVLQKAKTQSIDTLLTLSQLRWSGHLVRMSDDRLPKQLFYSELSEGHRLRGRPTLRFKDTLKKSLQNCRITTAHWETTASNRRVWKQLTRKGAAAYEQAKRRAHAEKRAATNAGTESRGSSIPCHVCGRICASAFGLRSHLRVHR
ncbi:hypothetical protein P5673_029297 [Acropora cervicornis]|uniref:C2H2-type domain-containing protein n=1 Tax=Acropora cervicornis TaxID=6130 RepID=A0AAD9PWU0_ACRCE|nr:hypothetical protein P5673_029297 [Acropora cervicornis]